MSKVITVKVIKSHDGIQCGRILRHTEAAWLKEMITKGYYEVVSDMETPSDKTTKSKKSKKK